MGAIEARIAESAHWYIGEDRSLVFDETDDANMTGWALTWELLDKRGGTVLLTKTTAVLGGITIGNGSATGDRVTVAIADTDTEAAAITGRPNGGAGTYYHQLKRTTDGSESVLAFGDAELLVRSGA